MSVELKIHKGTARGDSDLCSSCTNCHLSRDINGNETRVCQAVYMKPIILHERVDHCNHYYNKTLPPLSQMQEIAWEIVSKGERGARHIGFISPEDRRKAGIGYGPSSPPVGF